MTPGFALAFGPFELDPVRRRLSKSGEAVSISDRHLDILLALVATPGQTVAKDDLIKAGWHDVAVSDNSLEQAISSIRRVLGAQPDGSAWVDTVARRGYRFGGSVTRVAARESDMTLEALLAPHRAFLEGRAALETLDRAEVARARTVFERAVALMPDAAAGHIGLAAASVMTFEATRADHEPDRDALARATRHAREACRLDPHSAEAWATLGFALAQTGARLDAAAALQRATALEPTNWRHHFRLASVAWGEARLGAARRTLALLPDFPLAHWLAASVYVARQLPDEAERELTAGLRSRAVDTSTSHARFGAVALYWLRGLVHLARGDEHAAITDFEHELSAGPSSHLYARECAANTWYAIGALKHRQGSPAEATESFERALAIIDTHPLARAALGLHAPSGAGPIPAETATLARAVQLTVEGAHAEAAQVVTEALSATPAGNAFWLLPVEPMLMVSAWPAYWTDALAQLRTRAA